MTERDKIRICKGILKTLANIDLKATDINVTSFIYNTTITREGFKQHNISEVEFNNGVLEFLLLNHIHIFSIREIDEYPCDDNTAEVNRFKAPYYFNAVEITNYIDGKPHYITQLYLTVQHKDKEPTVTQIF